MLVWFVAFWIDFIREDIGQFPSKIDCEICFSIQFIWSCFVPDVKHVVVEMRFPRRSSYVQLAFR